MLLSWDPQGIRKLWPFLGNKRSHDQTYYGILTILGSLGHRKIVAFLGKLAFPRSNVPQECYYYGILTVSENCGLSQEISVPTIKRVVVYLLSQDPQVTGKSWPFLGNQCSCNQTYCRNVTIVGSLQYQKTVAFLRKPTFLGLSIFSDNIIGLFSYSTEPQPFSGNKRSYY